MSLQNEVRLLGRLGADPVVRATKSGMAVANMSLATNEKFGGKERTEWHRLVAFDKTAEIARQYFTKGKEIAVQGRLQTRKWKDSQGIDRWTTEILVDSVRMTGPAPVSRPVSRPPEEYYADEIAMQAARADAAGTRGGATAATSVRPTEGGIAPVGTLVGYMDDDIPF